MGSEKKESISLLSMYGDEDDDMEEDMDNDNRDSDTVLAENKEHSEVVANEAANMEEDYTETFNDTNADPIVTSAPANESTPPISIDNSTPPPPPPAQQVTSVEPRRGRKGTLTIVDYGHDETALSPEAEEGEIATTGRVMFGAELQTAYGTKQLTTPNTQSTPPVQPQFDAKGNETECVEAEEAADVHSINCTDDMDPLDKFLPPPPTTKCSDELQEKITKFLLLRKKTGRSFNSEVRNRKEYRNPDFLLHAVTYQDIDQIGSCFSKHVFDPHGYHKSDYYDEIEADLKRELERKEQEKKKNQKIDFLSAGTQPAAVAAAAVATQVMPPPVSAAIGTGTRPNKKSKWDKVDGDRKQHPLTTVSGQDSVGSAAFLSAGTGYTAFAQQRRREEEERRSSERKVDRRS